LQSNGCERYH